MFLADWQGVHDFICIHIVSFSHLFFLDIALVRSIFLPEFFFAICDWVSFLAFPWPLLRTHFFLLLETSSIDTKIHIFFPLRNNKMVKCNYKTLHKTIHVLCFFFFSRLNKKRKLCGMAFVVGQIQRQYFAFGARSEYCILIFVLVFFLLFFWYVIVCNLVDGFFSLLLFEQPNNYLPHGREREEKRQYKWKWIKKHQQQSIISRHGFAGSIRINTKE